MRVRKLAICSNGFIANSSTINEYVKALNVVPDDVATMAQLLQAMID